MTKEPGRYALLIGINNYKDKENFEPLKTPERDVQDIARQLMEKGIFTGIRIPPKNDFASLTTEIAEFYQKDEEEKRRKAEDLLLFYFAGHGTIGRRGRFVFVAENTEDNLLDATSIHGKAVLEEMNYSDAKRQIVILDCCFSGAFGTNRSTKTQQTQLIAFYDDQDKTDDPKDIQKGRFIIASTGKSRSAREITITDSNGKEKDISVFSSVLIEGLESGEADCDPRNGKITISELYKYIDKTLIKAKAKQSPTKNQMKWYRGKPFFIANNLKYSSLESKPDVKLGQSPKTETVTEFMPITEVLSAIKLILIRHKTGLLIYSEEVTKGLQINPNDISGLSASISSYLEVFSRTFKKEESQKAKFETLSSEGVHSLTWNGDFISITIVSDRLLPLDYHDRVTRLCTVIEKKFESQLRNLEDSEVQIADKQIKKLIRNFIPIDILELPERNAVIERGISLLNQKKYKEAIAVLDQLSSLETSVEKFTALISKGIALYRYKQYDNALKLFDEMISEFPKYPEPIYWKGESLIALDKKEKALKAFNKVLEQDPQYIDAMERKKSVLISLDRLEDALETLNILIPIGTQSGNKKMTAESWFTKGQVLLKLRSKGPPYRDILHPPLEWSKKEKIYLKEALFACNRTIELDPNHIESWLMRGAILGDLNRNREAISSYDRALKIDPNSDLACEAKADFLKNRERFTEAHEIYESFLALNPKNIEILRKKGYCLMKLERYKDAVEAFDLALRLDSSSVNTWLDRASCLEELDQYEDALRAYDRAIEIDPENSTAWFKKGNAFFGYNRFDEAIEAYNEALKIDPNNIPALFHKGEALQELRRYREASDTYKAVLSLDPRHNGANYQRGLMLLRQERYTEASAKLGNVSSEDPEIRLSVAMAYGEIYRGRKDYTLAVNSYDGVLEIDPTSVDAWFYKTICFMELGKNKEAEESIKKVKEFEIDQSESSFYSRLMSNYQDHLKTRELNKERLYIQRLSDGKCPYCFWYIDWEQRKLIGDGKNIKCEHCNQTIKI